MKRKKRKSVRSLHAKTFSVLFLALYVEESLSVGRGRYVCLSVASLPAFSRRVARVEQR